MPLPGTGFVRDIDMLAVDDVLDEYGDNVQRLVAAMIGQDVRELGRQFGGIDLRYAARPRRP
jgi:hypothetical protein